MGWWKSENGVIGDWPADILDAAIKKIEDAYLRDAGRLPTQGELSNLIEFCTCGTLRPVCGDPAHSFSKATAAEKDTPRAAKRGEQGASGPASLAGLKDGLMANVDPSTGKNYSASEARKVIEEQFKEAQRRKEMDEQ